MCRRRDLPYPQSPTYLVTIYHSPPSDLDKTTTFGLLVRAVTELGEIQHLHQRVPSHVVCFLYYSEMVKLNIAEMRKRRTVVESNRH